MLNSSFKQVVLRATGARELAESEVIQRLWSGYGEIVRIGLVGSEWPGVVVKHVRYPDEGNHPRGWNSDRSHQRKLHSYQVETEWYRTWSKQCTDPARVPACLALESDGDEVLIVLEDLDAAGYSVRRTRVNEAQLLACVRWLAHFHGTFLGCEPAGLWASGTYWHLETRPDELAALDDARLKAAASAIDARLKASPFQTLVHGDAKLANFCFSATDDDHVAAVDFQYVGGGCGMKDLAYFVGSCLRDADCASWEARVLDSYFAELRAAVDPAVDADALEADWRTLYPVAWTDFHRFIKGWSPGHWKISSYSERVAREVITQLEQEQSP